MTLRIAATTGIAALLAAAMACGGSSPTSPGGGGSGPGPVGATITIAPGGVTPGTVTISTGQSVMVVNNDARSHTISSDPHPSHTNCPPINIGTLATGQSRTSNAFASAQTCTYHDHDDPENESWRGTVRVQ
jgi:plastocyanin